jgi:hypothetical protein
MSPYISIVSNVGMLASQSAKRGAHLLCLRNYIDRNFFNLTASCVILRATSKLIGVCRFSAPIDLVERSNELFLSSRNADLLRQICNRAALLSAGEIVATGTVDKMIERYRE